MKLGEAIQRVQSMYSRGVQSKNTRLSSRHIYSALMSARSTLLQQQYNKNQKISQWAHQTLPCVELVPAKLHECLCVPDEGCTILRTKHKLPQPIAGIDKHLIQSVSSIDGIGEVYDESTLTGYRYNKGNKFTPDRSVFYPHNEYLFITLKVLSKAVMVVAPFGDVVAAAQFPSLCECDDCGCEDLMEMQFPFDSDLETALIQLASNECINMFKQMKQDINSNTIDTTSSGMIHQNQGQ